MTEYFEDWSFLQSIFDQILYREPSGQVRQFEVRDRATHTAEIITFADGSTLMLSARVPLPPLEDMTPRKVSYIKLNSERGEKMDDGSGEAMDLARQSGAMRFLEQISQILSRLPECDKVVCSNCEGQKNCSQCGGQGCAHCHGNGVCSTCGGRGWVASL